MTDGLSAAERGPGSRAGKVLVAKALCYIVYDGELLVIKHPEHSPETVGVQVPGGTVRTGETPEQAALREAREETGLTRLTVVDKLGETDYDITPHRFEIQHRHVFHLELHEPTPRRWISSEDHDGEHPPTTLECFWLPLAYAHVLQAGHGALLGRLHDRLLDTAGKWDV